MALSDVVYVAPLAGGQDLQTGPLEWRRRSGHELDSTGCPKAMWRAGSGTPDRLSCGCALTCRGPFGAPGCLAPVAHRRLGGRTGQADSRTLARPWGAISPIAATPVL